MAILIFLSMLFLSFQFNINSSNINVFIVDEAKTLIGDPSSAFPGNTFLLYLLYGHESVNFTLKDIYQKYRTNTSVHNAGFLIIGNDYSLGAVFDDTATNFIIALPGKLIQSIPIRLINNYFPKWYIIKDTTFDVVNYNLNVHSAKINSIEYCTPCEFAEFDFDNNAGKFDDNKMWIFEFSSDSQKFNFITYGYLESYDSVSGKGSINPVFYEWAHNSNTGMNFYIDEADSFTFTSS